MYACNTGWSVIPSTTPETHKIARVKRRCPTCDVISLNIQRSTCGRREYLLSIPEWSRFCPKVTRKKYLALTIISRESVSLYPGTSLKVLLRSTGFRENLLLKRGLKSVLKESKQTRKAKTVSREKEKVFCVLTCLEAFFCFRGRAKFEDREKEWLI